MIGFFRRPDVEDRRRQELVARVAVHRLAGGVDVEEREGLAVVDPHRLRVVAEQQPVALLALLQLLELRCRSVCRAAPTQCVYVPSRRPRARCSARPERCRPCGSSALPHAPVAAPQARLDPSSAARSLSGPAAGAASADDLLGRVTGDLREGLVAVQISGPPAPRSVRPGDQDGVEAGARRHRVSSSCRVWPRVPPCCGAVRAGRPPARRDRAAALLERREPA